MSDNNNDDDLYEDIKDTKPAAKAPPLSSSMLSSSWLPSSSLSSPAGRLSHSDRPLSLTEEVQYLKQRVQILEEENTNLQRNMGTLYRTAMAELKRKDTEIVRLQEELEAERKSSVPR